MKSLIIRETTENVLTKDGFVKMNISTKDLITMCLNANVSPSGGFSILEIRQRIKLLDRVEELDPSKSHRQELTLTLDEKEVELLKSIVNIMDEKKLFSTVSKSLLSFVDTVLAL